MDRREVAEYTIFAGSRGSFEKEGYKEKGGRATNAKKCNEIVHIAFVSKI